MLEGVQVCHFSQRRYPGTKLQGFLTQKGKPQPFRDSSPCSPLLTPTRVAPLFPAFTWQTTHAPLPPPPSRLHGQLRQGAPGGGATHAHHQPTDPGNGRRPADRIRFQRPKGSGGKSDLFSGWGAEKIRIFFAGSMKETGVPSRPPKKKKE